MGTSYWNLQIPETGAFDLAGELSNPAISDSSVFVTHPKGWRQVKPGLANPTIAQLDTDGRVWTRSYQTSITVSGMFAVGQVVPIVVHEFGPYVVLDFGGVTPIVGAVGVAVGTGTALPVSLRPKQTQAGTFVGVTGGVDTVSFYSLANTGVITLSVTAPGTGFGAGPGLNGWYKFAIMFDRRL